MGVKMLKIKVPFQSQRSTLFSSCRGERELGVVQFLVPESVVVEGTWLSINYRNGDLSRPSRIDPVAVSSTFIRSEEPAQPALLLNTLKYPGFDSQYRSLFAVELYDSAGTLVDHSLRSTTTSFIAKAELKTLRKEHSFELTTVDIQSPGQERWKRRYVYWIPALHLDDVEIAKGRWDANTVRPACWAREKIAQDCDMEVVEQDKVGVDGREVHYMDSQKSEISEDNLFFFDASAMTAWPTLTTQYDTTQSATTLGVPSQDNTLMDEEPPYDPDAEYVQSSAKQCFNCMATNHIVSDCPHKRDPQHISLARADYGSRGGNTARSVRLHEAEEEFKRRTGFARTFEPGYVQGELLRESLGLSKIYGGGNEDLPWYYTMCDWGYPPGWVSDIDPRSKIMKRLNLTRKCESNERFQALAIFDDGDSESPLGPNIDHLENNPPTTPLPIPDNSPSQPPAPRTPPLEPPPGSTPPPPPPDDIPPPPDDLPPPPPDFPPPDSLPFPPQRWAHYRTTLFQSERLPISLVSRPLPALSEAPPPPPSGVPPPPPSAPPPPSPPQPAKELTEQEKRRLLWEQIVAANS
ncbi:hypothetical protein B0J17DRAFT_631429 [Rhizoctonia solani]|nr:hypothetical protein B0J17DRAFT_631429 [Rhizoctonia solani]